MARKTKVFELTEGSDSYEFSVTHYSARQGLRIKGKLLKLLGPSFGAFMAAEENPAMITVGVKELVSKFAIDDHVFNLMLEILSETKYKDPSEGFLEFSGPKAETVFDNVFSANYKVLYEIIYKITEYNFGPLIVWLGPMLTDWRPNLQEKLENLPTDKSVGQSESLKDSETAI